MLTAAQRLERKVTKIVSRHDNQRDADNEINMALDVQEILTATLLPLHSTLRTRIMGAFLRDTTRRRELAEQKRDAVEEEMVQVEIPGGGKCKITTWMTKKQAEREWGSR